MKNNIQERRKKARRKIVDNANFTDNFAIFDDEHIMDCLEVTQEEIREFEQNLGRGFAEANTQDLLIDCRKRTIENIIGPLGLGKFVSLYDRVGGNVDTIQNVRQTGADGKPIGTGKFQKDYDNNEEYDSTKYHKDERYKKKNKEVSEQKNKGALDDSYTDKHVEQNQDTDLDHVISAKEINDDPGRVLAGIDGVGLANSDSNLKATDKSINRSKKAKSMSEFIAYLDATREQRQKEIDELKDKQELTDKERKKLKKLIALESADKELMLKTDKEARDEYNSKINWAYYTSTKFYKDLGISSGVEGIKMGFQQSVGLLCTDLSNALFDEIVDMFRHGVVDGVHVQDTLSALKLRLRRVAVMVWSDWKNLTVAFKDGAVSGVISNVITTLINIFFTTAKNIVRIIREGTFVLFRAAKTIFLSPKNADPADIWDAAVKIIVTGAGTLGGIALEEALSKGLVSIPLIVPIASELSAVLSGILTGLATSVTLFAIEKWDPFGIRDVKKRRYIQEKLLEIGDKHISNLDALCLEYGIVCK
jgi:hypothetical protein